MIALENSPDEIIADQLVPPPPSIGYAAVVDAAYMDTPFMPANPRELVDKGDINKDIEIFLGMKHSMTIDQIMKK